MTPEETPEQAQELDRIEQCLSRGVSPWHHGAAFIERRCFDPSTLWTMTDVHRYVFERLGVDRCFEPGDEWQPW